MARESLRWLGCSCAAGTCAAWLLGLGRLWFAGEPTVQAAFAVVGWGPLTVASPVWTASVALSVLGPLAVAKRNGAWHALAACGVSGRQVGVLALVPGLLGFGVALWLTQQVQPMAHRALARALTGQVVPSGAQVHRTGGATVWTTDEGVLWVDAVGVTTARVAETGRGTVVLRDGRWMSRDSVMAASFATYRPTGGNRVELDGRSTDDLAAAAARTSAAGRDASYEWAVWWKRWLQPLGLLWMPWALVPVALGRRPWLHVGLLACAVAVVVRLGDGAATWIGPVAVASTGPLTLFLCGLVGWAAWNER